MSNVSSENRINSNPNRQSHPNYRVRRGVALLALGTTLTGAFIGGNKLWDRITGTGPVQTPVPAHVGDRVYQVKQGDTLTGIVHRAHPEYTLYGAEFEQAESRLDRQLPADDQFMGNLHPGETLVLDEGSNIGQPER